MSQSHRLGFVMLCLAAMLFAPGCSRAVPPAAEKDAVAPVLPKTNFDGERAFDLLKKQVAIGPRYSGTPGHARTVRLISGELKRYADSIALQQFTATACGKKLPMTNIIASFNTAAKKTVLLAAHWDSRPTADQEISAEKRRLPIPGANDGASGVAVLLELARQFSQRKPQVGVLMVFFDGEDYGPGEAEMLLGSKHFASTLKRSAVELDGRQISISYGILLDMVGDKDLKIYQERNSVAAAPDVVRKVWSTAERLGYRDQFVPEVNYAISDDHIPLIDAGVRCIDVIDFDYAPWHTLDDTPDKCSPASLDVVGTVIAEVVYSEKGS